MFSNIPRNVKAKLDNVGPSLPTNMTEYSSNIDPLSNLKFLISFVSTSASGLLLKWPCKTLSSKKKCTFSDIPRYVKAMLDSVGPSLPINTMEYSSNIDPLRNLKFLPSFVSISASRLLLEVASSETTTLGNSEAISSMMDSGKKQIKNHIMSHAVLKVWLVCISGKVT